MVRLLKYNPSELEAAPSYHLLDLRSVPFLHQPDSAFFILVNPKCNTWTDITGIEINKEISLLET